MLNEKITLKSLNKVISYAGLGHYAVIFLISPKKGHVIALMEILMEYSLEQVYDFPILSNQYMSLQ